MEFPLVKYAEVSVSKKNSKMGRVWSVSMPPVISCVPGIPCAFNGECYALKAWNMYPSCRDAWTGNMDLWANYPAQFEATLKQVLAKARKKPELFRWHVAGDIPRHDPSGYLKMAVRIAEQFPEIRFLMFTKRYDVVNQLDRNLPANMTIIFSAWPGLELDNPKGFPVAWMNDGTDERIPDDVIPCAGRCDECAICWGIRGSVVFNKH